MSHRSCPWTPCSPRLSRCRWSRSWTREDRYRAHFVDRSWSVSCCYPRSSCMGSISLWAGSHHHIHCMISSSFRLIEDSLELFRLLFRQNDGETVEQYLLGFFELRVVSNEQDGSIGDLADVRKWRSLSLEFGRGEGNAGRIGKIENLNLVAHIYLYLLIEFFRSH